MVLKYEYDFNGKDLTIISPESELELTKDKVEGKKQLYDLKLK